MELTHAFTVPASMAETWTALNDIEAVAGCFPGATVTEADGDSFTGSCKVKLGPIALVYNGSGTFVEKNEDTGTLRIEARGKDKRGNGTAGADVTARLRQQSSNSTAVEVHTDLNITGKPAQFGRGVMQDVSDKLLAQFVECLQGRVGGPAEQEQTEEASERAPEEGTDTATTGDPEERSGAAASPSPTPTPTPTPPPTQSAAHATGTEDEQWSEPRDDALDLGATVLPVIARSYGPRIAAALAGVALFWVVRRLLRR